MTRAPIRNDLSSEFVRTILDYDARTGILRWKEKRSPHLDVGSIAGKPCKVHGYVSIMINRHTYKAHRLAWLIYHGHWPHGHLDHIDGNRANNAICNLREATVSENCKNRIRQGFYYHKSSGRYRASISINGEVVILGWFATADEAKAVYEAACDKYHGEFSVFCRPNLSRGVGDFA